MKSREDEKTGGKKREERNRGSRADGRCARRIIVIILILAIKIKYVHTGSGGRAGHMQ